MPPASAPPPDVFLVDKAFQTKLNKLASPALQTPLSSSFSSLLLEQRCSNNFNAFGSQYSLSFLDEIDFGTDAFRRNPPHSIVTTTLGVLQGSAIQGLHLLQGGGRGTHFHAAVMDLIESSLYAVGSMCGSTVVPGLEQHIESIEFLEADAASVSREEASFRQRRCEASAAACNILTGGKKHLAAVLPAMLIGGFGEKTATASLRLALAITKNGNLQQHAKLAASGILVPIADFLQNALSTGDQFRFSPIFDLSKTVVLM